MGLFTRRSATPQIDVPAATTQPAKAKPFRIELGWRGMFSLVLVVFCLLFWMFVLGIWAGQTILFPQRGVGTAPAMTAEKSSPARVADQAAPSR